MPVRFWEAGNRVGMHEQLNSLWRYKPLVFHTLQTPQYPVPFADHSPDRGKGYTPPYSA